MESVKGRREEKGLCIYPPPTKRKESTGERFGLAVASLREKKKSSDADERAGKGFPR